MLKQPVLFLRLLLILAISLLFATSVEQSQATNNYQSQPFDIPPNSQPLDIPLNLATLYETDALLIQFVGHTKMRVNKSLPQAQHIPIDQNSEVSAADVNALYALSAGGQWQRSHTVAEARLEEIWQKALANTSEELPDPNNRYRLHLPDGTDIVAMAQQIHHLPAVEAVYFIPKPVTTASTVDYSTAGSVSGNPVVDPYQGYLDPAPNGVDARFAWLGMGGRGDGMRICDVEYDYNANHADLPNVTFVGEPKDPPYPPDHGTAVLGEMAGRNNGVGVTGIAYQAQYYFAAAKTTTGGYDVGAAVLACADNLTTGDVILIEQQASGPNATGNGQVGLVPVEWVKPWYDDIKIAVAAGMIVVEAAGNGGENLDDPIYSTGNNGHYPFLSGNDSGAIIVGAANPPSFGTSARFPSSFSNYGSTVDMHGWGGGIVTTGYGTLFPGGGIPNPNQENEWYAVSFGGTSGASPMVAASAAIVQRHWELTHGGSPATPGQIKQILRNTGTPQNGSNNIGPLPNLRAAILDVLGDSALDVAPPIITPASGTYQMPLQVTIGYGASQNGDNTLIRYTLNGDEPSLDSFIFFPEQGDTLYLNYGVTVKAKAFQTHAPTQRVYESESAVATYVSSTPKVETPTISPDAGTYNQGTQLILTTETPGTEIRYRLDGRTPSFFYPGTEYNGPVTLPAGEHEVTARGYKDGYYKSDTARSGQIVINEIVLPSPIIYPNGGNFNGDVTVYMGSTVLGAEIRYTLDGSTPTENSTQFTEPFVLEQTTTVKMRIYLDGYTPSNVVETTFNVTAQAQAPVIDPNGGEFTDSVQVSLSAPNAGAVIRYTTNGAEPTSYSTEYSGPFTLGIGEHTVKAKAYLGSAQPSDTTTAQFTVFSSELEQVEAPIIDPLGGNHTGSVTVTMRSDTEGAIIRYTFDPLSNENTWTAYTGFLTLTPDENAQVIRAKAYKTGMADSELAQTSFNVFDPSLTGQIEVPDVAPSSGTYNDVVQVTVDGHTNPPFKIRQLHITTDGTEPRPSSNTGNGQSSPRNLTISKSTTVKAVASQLGWYNSDVVTREYLLVCATPEITTAEVNATTRSVTISTITPNATIRYTIGGSSSSDGSSSDGSSGDGSSGSPVTETSTEYTAPFEVGVGATVINAKCYRNGFAESAMATEIVLIEEQVAPTFTQQPQSVTVDEGTDVTLNISVTGIPIPAIQWQFNGADIAGETEPVLDIPSVGTANAGNYRAIVRNAAGEVTSDVATVTVNAGIPPSGLSIDSFSPTNLGSPTFLAASITSGSGISYTWSFGDGTTGAGQSIQHTYAAIGNYTVNVTATNEVGNESASIMVQVVEPVVTPTMTPTVTPTVTVTTTPTDTPTDTPTPTPAAVTVNVRNNIFEPTTITIQVGDTVEWKRIEGFHNVREDNDLFRLGDENGNPSTTWDTVSFTFTEPGTYGYYCEAHGDAGGIGMAGVVIVEAVSTPEPTETSTVDPSETPTANPSETPTANPSETATIEPNETPDPETPTPETPTGTTTPEPSVTDSLTPTGTITSEPSATPTAEPQPEDIVISEVYYLGEGADQDWIELQNIGSSPIDISEWWFCSRFSYQQLSAITTAQGAGVQGADLTLDLGEVLVLPAWTDLDNTAADLAIYTNDPTATDGRPNFGSPDHMVDYVQWGSSDAIGRSTVAATKGIWPEVSTGVYDFIPTAAAGESVALVDPSNATNAGGFVNGAPSQGTSNGPALPTGANTINLFLPFVAE